MKRLFATFSLLLTLNSFAVTQQIKSTCEVKCVLIKTLSPYQQPTSGQASYPEIINLGSSFIQDATFEACEQEKNKVKSFNAHKICNKSIGNPAFNYNNSPEQFFDCSITWRKTYFTTDHIRVNCTNF